MGNITAHMTHLPSARYSVSGQKSLLWCFFFSEETWTDGENEGRNEGGRERGKGADLASHER